MIDFSTWLAPVLFGVALVAVFAAVLARSLFATSMYLAAGGALAASGMALLGVGQSAALVGVLFAAWAPLILLAVILLSTRTTKVQRRARPWLSIAAAGSVGALMLWGAPELGVQAEHMTLEPDFVGGWLAPLVIVAALACVGLVGYGERGALQRHGDER